MPEHQERGEMMRQLIDRCCGESVSRVKAPNKRRAEQQSSRTVDRRIAKIRRNRIPSVLRLNTFDRAFYLVEGFRPTDPFPTTFGAAHRMSQPILVRVDVLQRYRFRTDVAAAERVVFVAANVERLIIPDTNFDPADRLAQ